MKSASNILCLLIFFLGIFPIQEAFGDNAASSKIQHQNEITEIDFWMDELDFFHIDIKGHGDFSASVELNNQNRLEALLPKTWVSPSMVRLYRLDDFETPVKSFFLQNSEKGVRLIWVWDRSLPFEIISGKDITTFRFSYRETQGPLQPGLPDTAGHVSSPNNQSGFYPGLGHSLAEPQKEYTGAPISIDLQNAEVEHVLRLITSITDHNLILDEDVQGKVSMRLNNVPWDQALDLVLAQKNLAKIHRGNIIRITTASKLQQEIEQVRRAREEEARSRESMRQMEPLEQAFIQINYARAQDLQPRVQELLSGEGRVTFDERSNKLIIRDTQSQIREIKELVRNLDRIERQVLIEARVVYATESFRRELGVEWGMLYKEQIGRDFVSRANLNMLAHNFPWQTGVPIIEHATVSIFSLDAILRLGEQQNQSRTISSPKIMTLNNQQAEIEQGERIRREVVDERGLRTEYEDAVLRLTVLPQITPEDNLILNLEVRDDTPAVNGINTKVARTTLLVDDGETIVIGGIRKIFEEDGENRVPGLGNIPVLGWLFKNQRIEESKDELLIFIRPKII